MSTQITKEQFELIYNETYNKTLKYIICKCNKLEDVNDIIQDTYVELYKNLKRKNKLEIEKIDDYIIGITKNILKKYYKNKKINSKKIEETPAKKNKKTYSVDRQNGKSKKKKKSQDEYYRMDNLNQEDLNQENIVRGKTQRKFNETQKQNKKLTKKQELQRKRRKFVFRIIKWLMLLGIIIGGIIFALLSPIFNIKNINK